MSNPRECLAESRAIITSACAILTQAQEGTAILGREIYASSEDCYILLRDATKLFCRAVSEIRGEPEPNPRWSPAVAELLLSQPDQCQQALAWLERNECQPAPN